MFGIPQKNNHRLPTVTLVGLVTLGLATCQSQPVNTMQQAQEILGELDIDMHDMSYTPTAQDVPREGRYRVKAHNKGQMPYDIVFDNGVIFQAGPGASAQTELDISSKGLAYHCSLPGHSRTGRHARHDYRQWPGAG